ncbi:DNA-methyltransferase [Siccirubricoccus deserti]
MSKVENDHRADWREAWALFPGEVAYVWHGALHATTVAESLTATGFEIRAQVIWAKDRLVLGRGHYHWQHEPCWYAVRGTEHWSGDRKQTTLWQIASRSQDAETVHGTQKPVECMRRPIVNNSSPGQAVYEPFSGSGTTLIAAEMEGRACHALELSPAYVDVALTRWQAFTGQPAMLEGMAGASPRSPPCAPRRPHMPALVDPTEEDRRLVRAMSGFGIPQEQIATHLGIDAKTLRKHFRQDLDRGMVEATAKVAQSLFQMATTGKNVAAAIF